MIIIAENDINQILACIKQEKEKPLQYNVKEKQEKFDKNSSYQRYISIYQELCNK